MSRRSFAASVSAVFFVSGAVALMYQVVWSRLLQQVFGVSIHAVAIVLATFLGGLALGSWLLGPSADRARIPLRVYALLELGICATALAGAVVLHAVAPLQVATARRLGPGSPTLLFVNVVIAALVVVPPTFLMGGTLPAVTRALIEHVRHLGRDLGLLYALNTAGAVAGSVAAGFVLIRGLGVHGTLFVCAGLNLALGAASLLLARRAAPVAQPEPEGPPPEGSSGLLLVMALSGAASLALEVIWTRMLILVVGTSTYAFVTVLSAFLVGIAIGGFGARVVVTRLRNLRRGFGFVELGIAVSTLATVPALAHMMGPWQRQLDAAYPGWLTGAGAWFGISFAVMLVPATLIGATFPLAATVWARGTGTLGSRLGQLYAANTLGNIAGALVGAFVLLPLLGMQRGVAALTLLNLACAAWALRPARSFAVAAVGAGSIWAAALVWQQPRPLPAVEESDTDAVLFYEEGAVSTVKVVQRASDARQRVMFADGVRIGQSATGVDRKQQVLAHLPFLLARTPPARVLTIGLGTGILAGEILKHPSVHSLDVVELSDSVIRAARLFSRFNGGVLDNPAARVINADGINFLQDSAGRYDAIVSDGKSRSGHAGNASFYSADYYLAAREHLSAGGLMVQWVPLEVAPEDLRILLRTFAGTFPSTAALVGPDSLFLVGSQKRIRLDPAQVAAELRAPATEDLRRHGYDTAEAVAALLVADGDSLRPWLTREGGVNSLERPLLEFYSFAAVSRGAAERTADNLAALLRTRKGPLRSIETPAPEWMDDAFQRARPALESLAEGEVEALSSLLAGSGNGVLRQWAATEVFHRAYARDTAGALAEALDGYQQALRIWPGFGEALVNLGRASSLLGQRGEAMEALREALRLNPESGSAHAQLAQVLALSGDPQAAEAEFREALRIGPGDAAVHDNLGLLLASLGRPREALAEFEAAMQRRPDWPLPVARAALLTALSLHDPARAIALARKARSLSPEPNVTTVEVLAACYAAAGRYADAAAEESEALRLAVASGDKALSAAAEQALQSYRAGRMP